MSKTLKITILGCGSSGGVPRIGGDWGACDPSEPKNRRRRSSILVEQGEGTRWTRVLVDSSPDLYEQFYNKKIDWLDGVLYTHYHADQTHGINDLRAFFLNRFQSLKVYMDDDCAKVMTEMFRYCFEGVPNASGRGYPKFLDLHRLEVGKKTKIKGEGGTISAQPLLLHHGAIDALGFCFNEVAAYCPDVVDIPEETFAALSDIDCWIVDALRRDPHPTHAHLAKTLSWLERVRPKRGVLTNMHIDLDYAELKKELADFSVPTEPAFDDMVLSFDV